MRIAFDLDDTLIPSLPAVPRELPTLLARCTARESLRRGTVELLRSIHALGGEVWVYTTSFRSAWEIRWLFLSHGVWLRGIVNQYRHVRTLTGPLSSYRSCSKYPPAFGIDLLVDDSEGVAIEGRRYEFRVLRVDPGDESWAERVREEVRKSLGK
jgi:hypothetical protein